MNQDLKDSLIHLITKIRENSNFHDKLGNIIGNKEWISVVSLFLLICEIGTTEKIDAYNEIIKIFEFHNEIIEIALSDELFSRLFRDSVSESLEVSKLSLQMLKILTQNLTITKSLISKRLLYNLITKVATKHPENIQEIIIIIQNISTHGDVIWKDEALEPEVRRIMLLLLNNK